MLPVGNIIHTQMFTKVIFILVSGSAFHEQNWIHKAKDCFNLDSVVLLNPKSVFRKA